MCRTVSPDRQVSSPLTGQGPIPTDDLETLPSALAGVAWGVALGVLVDLPLGFLLGIRGIWLVLFALVAGFAMAILIRRITATVTEGTAAAFLYMIWPSGGSTPYKRTYSHEQALAAKGDLDGALSRYRVAMRLNPTDPEPRIQAAELLFRSDTPESAVALFDEARRLSEAHELYVTQRLIDLYLGPLDNDIRVLVELRRLTERFPGSLEADAAHKLLARLKQEYKGVEV